MKTNLIKISMYRISKEFEFCASHQLRHLEEGHPCMRVHGHNYKVIVTFEAKELNKDGFICDYRKLERIKRLLDNGFDHKHLNDFLSFQPSAENIARHIYDLCKVPFPELVSVTVKETDKTAATYEE